MWFLARCQSRCRCGQDPRLVGRACGLCLGLPVRHYCSFGRRRWPQLPGPIKNVFRMHCEDLHATGASTRVVWVPSHSKMPKWEAPIGLCSDKLRELNSWRIVPLQTAEPAVATALRASAGGSNALRMKSGRLRPSWPLRPPHSCFIVVFAAVVCDHGNIPWKFDILETLFQLESFATGCRCYPCMHPEWPRFLARCSHLSPCRFHKSVVTLQSDFHASCRASPLVSVRKA